ncbi:hypothetical protein [Phyllobacterium zundukense]|uniref:hypothetical protein n=1 Tax=Phyllobacterium zundukense TaxID=1867719 RepID=UPI001300020B|nr:hypothetical protein [Phyllobacterium zundukense]
MDIFFDFLTEKLLGVAKRGYLAKILTWTGIGLLMAISLLYSYDRLVEFVNFYFGTDL